MSARFRCEVVPQGDSYVIEGQQLCLRPMPATLGAGCYVAYWRNQSAARAAFWNQDVVTPDSHVAFMQRKSPYDVIWLAEERATGNVVGMAALDINPHTHSGEAGRYYIDSTYRGLGYAQEIDAVVLAVGFDYFRLTGMWLDAWADNAAIVALHKKVGWREIGIDVPNHTHVGGAVIHMALTSAEWEQLRCA